jgi:hypothetical protein
VGHWRAISSKKAGCEKTRIKVQRSHSPPDAPGNHAQGNTLNNKERCSRNQSERLTPQEEFLSQLDMEAHTCNPSTQRQRQEDCETKAGLVHIVRPYLREREREREREIPQPQESLPDCEFLGSQKCVSMCLSVYPWPQSCLYLAP